MNIQRELKIDLTSITGAIETQEGIYVPLKEVERLLTNRIRGQSLPIDKKEIIEILENLSSQSKEDGKYLWCDYFGEAANQIAKLASEANDADQVSN